MSVTSLSERKTNEAARRDRAASAVTDALRAYAAATGGRFVLFGSFVDRRMRYDSDLDILIDFPADGITAAWDVVERACAEADIMANISDTATSKPAFVERVFAKGLVLGPIRRARPHPEVPRTGLEE